MIPIIISFIFLYEVLDFKNNGTKTKNTTTGCKILKIIANFDAILGIIFFHKRASHNCIKITKSQKREIATKIGIFLYLIRFNIENPVPTKKEKIDVS